MNPVLGVATPIWTFFIRKRFLFKFCGRTRKELKFFYGTVLLAILCSLLPFNYLRDHEPKCGPHQGKKVLVDIEATLDKDMLYTIIVLFSYAFNSMLETLNQLKWRCNGALEPGQASPALEQKCQVEAKVHLYIEDVVERDAAVLGALQADGQDDACGAERRLSEFTSTR